MLKWFKQESRTLRRYLSMWSSLSILLFSICNSLITAGFCRHFNQILVLDIRTHLKKTFCNLHFCNMYFYNGNKIKLKQSKILVLQQFYYKLPYNVQFQPYEPCTVGSAVWRITAWLRTRDCGNCFNISVSVLIHVERIDFFVSVKYSSSIYLLF